MSRLRPPFALLTLLCLPALAATSPVPESWLAKVNADLARDEYRLAPGADGGWIAPNRAQDLRAAWRDGVLEIAPRTEPGGWRFELELVALGRGTAHQAIARPSAESVSVDRIEWRRAVGAITEWHVNDARGIEQGFTLENRAMPEAAGPLRLELRASGLGAHPAEDGSSVLLRTPSGEAALRIRELHVSDARGREIPACLDAGAGMLTIVIDDAGAEYPLTVDPLLTSPSWTATSVQANAQFGFSVATAGDVNGDGYADVIVGAPMWSMAFARGLARVYLGSPAGLALTPAWEFTDPGGGATFNLGSAVATAGDVNGDGFSDVLVGAHAYANGQSREGRALVFHGHAAGLSAAPDWTVESDQVDAELGEALAPAGDVNGDGYDDVLIASSRYDGPQPGEGRAWLYLGSSSGLAATPSWTAEGDQDFASFGTSVAAAGDVDGDGYDDVIVGAPGFANGETSEGRAFLYRGSATGLDAAPAWTFESDVAFTALGGSVATAGDVNGDGYADVVIGADRWSNGESQEGRALLFLGSATGLAPTPAWTKESDEAGALMGVAVATAGDADGDGYADVLVAASHHDAPGLEDAGRVFLYRGSAAGLSPVAAWSREGETQFGLFGLSVGPAGDVDADGFSDVIVGGPFELASQNGEAFVFHGSSSTLRAGESWRTEGEQDDAELGASVAFIGDVNGDGFSDVAIGAPWWDGRFPNEGRVTVHLGAPQGPPVAPDWEVSGQVADTFLGSSVAGAGDVNGDGYSDLVIAAAAPFGDRPAVILAWHGSATGLGPGGNPGLASWFATTECCPMDVAGAGDVNGDGFGDLIVGELSHDAAPDDDRGQVRVFLGSAAGLAATHAWSLEGADPGGQLGTSVGTAGDVNGDGYSDVIAGAPGHGLFNEGAAFVVHGSARGLAASPAWSTLGTRATERRGRAVATAGDVNGDGFSDVIVGAPGHDIGARGEGGAFVFHGSSSGLEPLRAWTMSGGQAGAAAGSAVASAGDVNGDGFSDVIVGLPRFHGGDTNDGEVRVFHGSASGLATGSAWGAYGGVAYANLGASVAGAGDVNGDGYGDVLAGAPNDSLGNFEEGRASLWLGGGGRGLARIARQALGDASAPIDLLGATSPADGFRIRALGRTPFGRDQVRLEWEVEPLATPFDGASPSLTPFIDTGLPDASGSTHAFDEPHAPLPADGPWHWRLRVRSGFVFPWVSRWMSLPGNAPTETDLLAITFVDSDGDTIRDANDNCVTTPNPAQADADSDGSGDACDPCPLDALDDADGDGACADVDNCPTLANAAQLDSDGDGVGNACDPCRVDAPDDVDGDGACDGADICPGVADPAQFDADGDGAGDACDPCFGDQSAGDADADGACDDVDTCPSDSDPRQEDSDADGVGDACESCVEPSDLVGRPGAEPLRVTRDPAGLRLTWEDLGANAHPAYEGSLASLRVARAYDHVRIAEPALPAVALPLPAVDSYYLAGAHCGAFFSSLGRDSFGVERPGPSANDRDGDTLPDPLDACPDDAAQADADGDGLPDACDACPAVVDPRQIDADSDGAGDACDNCPLDANPLQESSDADLLGDACDNCPLVADPFQRDMDADGIGDACDGPPVPCQADCGALGVGTTVGTCALPFVLQRGLEGAANPIGPVSFPDDWDCRVLVLNIAEEWVGWSHLLADDLQQLHVEYHHRGLTVVTLISQDVAGNPATFATLESWESMHGSEHPLLLDESESALNAWFETLTCAGFPQTFVFDRDAVQTEFICGYDPTAIRAAVEALIP